MPGEDVEMKMKNLITCLVMCAINVVAMRMVQADVITQNPVCDVDSGTAVACGNNGTTVENWFARNFYIDQTTTIYSVWWGSYNPTTVSANIYFSVASGPGNPEDVTLTQVGTATQALNAGPWYSTPVDIPFEVAAGSYLVVEFQMPDTGTDLGILPACTETATETTYLKADDCAIFVYEDIAAIGFPDAQIIMCLNGNGPCERGYDCNLNGIDDCLDLTDGTSYDCNANGVPDECDIEDGTSGDINGNGIPDECDTITADCNGNGIDDVLDIKSGFSYDCDGNWVPDECQPDCDGDGFIDPCDNEPDCDSDGIPDNCEADCNENDIPDDCDIIWEISEDVNNDGIPDECQDCNKNGIPDPVDIADGTSEDADGNGIPDECQYPVTWTVDDDGKADFDNIQAAIDAAGSLPNHDDILVYPGTYPAGIDMLGKEVWLHSSDGPEVTIIDGEETLFGIVCESGETNDTVIEGFTITNCNRANTFPYGAGMTCSFSSPTVINCIFASNYADAGGGMGLFNSSPSIIGCVFENNNTEWNGAGMWCSDHSYPTISGCQFLNNIVSDANWPGGGIISLDGSNAFISDTLFCGNFSDQISGSWTDLGGTCISVTCDDSDGDGWPDQCGTIDDGVHHVPDEYPTIQQAINAAGDHDEIVVAPGIYSTCESTNSYWDAVMCPLGKRLWIHSSSGADVTIIDAQNCRGGSFNGGETTGLVIEGFTFTSTTSNVPTYMFLSATTFRNCVFTNAETQGAVHCGIGVPEFEDCTFTNNSTAVALDYWGGGSYETYGTAKFTNCTFRNNNNGGISEGVAISMTDGMDLELSNCLFENNSGNGGSAIIYTGSEYTDSVITDCVFRNNEASGGAWGGTIFQSYHSGNLNMQSCLFENNTSEYSFFYDPQWPQGDDYLVTIHASEFKNNGGWSTGAAIGANGTLIIEDCLIKENLGGIRSPMWPTCTGITLIDTVVCSNGSYQICDGWIDGGGNSIAEVCFDDCQASDITDDGIVDVSDILAILGYWGSSIPAGDVDGNGVVDIGDLLMVVGNWGPCE
jgi:hypothetical protein